MKNVLIEGLYLNPKVKEIKFKSLSTSVDKNKVKVKWVASAVCNSERRRLLGLKNHKNLEEFGAGHEGVGVVNDNKKNLVILLPHNNCITRKYINKSKKFILCNNCETGKINICSKMKHAGLENNEPFSFSSFSYVNQSQLKKISNLQIEKAIFTEPLSCVLRAWKLVSNNSFIVKKKNVLVIGGGPIGSLHALYISKILKNNVYIYEKNRIRRKVLKKIFHDNQKVQILEILNNVFYDISIMATSEKSGYEYCKKNTFEKKEMNELNDTFNDYKERIFKTNSKTFIKIVRYFSPISAFKPLNIYLEDIKTNIIFDIFSEKLEITNNAPDIEMSSESLFFIMKNTFGFDTLTVNGCFEEKNEQGFAKMTKSFAIENLNNIGIKFNFYIIFNFKLILLFFERLSIVSKKIKNSKLSYD